MYQIEIKLPFKTPTINHLHGHNKMGNFYLKPEAKKLKEEIKEEIFKLPIVAKNFFNKKLKVRMEVHEDWFTKKGEVKRKDVANREKFLIDSVFDALELDDKFIFKHNIVKVQDNDREFSIIKIEVFDESR